MDRIESPRPVTDETIEQEIRRKKLTASRVKPADLDAQVSQIQYHVFDGTMLTVCCITMKNGFNVVGESACVSPENFDKEIGERIAFENAKQKMWPLLGYALLESIINPIREG